jgi:hypothetical protein
MFAAKTAEYISNYSKITLMAVTLTACATVAKPQAPPFNAKNYPVLYSNDGFVFVRTDDLQYGFRIGEGDDPDWSDDGNKIVYETGSRIAIYTLDDRKTHATGVSGWLPQWVDNDRHILFTQRKADSLDGKIMLMEADTFKTRQIGSGHVLGVAGKEVFMRDRDTFCGYDMDADKKLPSPIPPVDSDVAVATADNGRVIAFTMVGKTEEGKQGGHFMPGEHLGVKTVLVLYTEEPQKSGALEATAMKAGYTHGDYTMFGPEFSNDASKLAVIDTVFDHTDIMSLKPGESGWPSTNSTVYVWDLGSKTKRTYCKGIKDIIEIEWAGDDDSMFIAYMTEKTYPTEVKGMKVQVALAPRFLTPQFVEKNNLDKSYLNADQICLFRGIDDRGIAFSGHSVDYFVEK